MLPGLELTQGKGRVAEEKETLLPVDAQSVEEYTLLR